MGNVHQNCFEKKARYIVRFDDLCPTMNWKIWEQICAILDEYNIKPIIAVIPNNKDPELIIDNENIQFWEKICQYQNKGWMIALHGYSHVYTNHNAGIMGISANSEFAGLSYVDQKRKIVEGIKIFKENGINAKVFVAPSHSFDVTTLEILKENGVKVISDGHTSYPYKSDGFVWIPCQMWDCFKDKKHGLYTVCFHHNRWNINNIKRFKEDIIAYRNMIINPADITDVEELSFIGDIKTKLKRSELCLKRAVKQMIGE